LGWGVTTGITFSIVMAAIQGWDRLPILLPLALVLFPIGGIFWGKWMWKWGEARYQKAMQDRADT
jgi:hypothetical protein